MYQAVKKNQKKIMGFLGFFGFIGFFWVFWVFLDFFFEILILGN
jgi:hypothetical protein